MVPIQSDLRELKTETVPDIYGQIGDLNTKETTLKDRVDGLDEDSSEQSTEITDMRGEVSSLQSTLSQILDNNPQLETNMASLENRNNEIWTKLLDLQTSISQVCPIALGEFFLFVVLYNKYSQKTSFCYE